MPPINPGSRTALVTTTVVLSIVSVVCLIFAIYFYVRADNVEQTAADMTAQYRDIVASAALTGEEVTQLRNFRGTTEDFPQSMSLLDVALRQRDLLARRLAGVTGYNEAMTTSQNALEAAAQVGRASDNLFGAVDNTLATLRDRQTEVANLQQQLQEAQTKLTATLEDIQQQRQAMDKQLAEVRSEAASVLEGAATDRAGKDEQFARLISDHEAAMQSASENAQQLTVQIADLTKRLDSAQLELTTLREKLGGQRVQASANIVRQADGRIVRIPGGDIVYIDLGRGDQITPGMTFQVYDRAEGIPALGDPTTDENLPRGKASIEVIRVGPTSSEARVVRVQPGQALAEGDLIMNLVYDRNVRYNFFVYGNFDLDQNGVATPEDTEVIRRLITQWGGRLTDQVNVNTDFVVMGQEPQIPNFTREELEDPINLSRYNEALQELQNYQDVLAAARSLHVPILNQNRFLYFVGFYELARR